MTRQKQIDVTCPKCGKIFRTEAPEYASDYMLICPYCGIKCKIAPTLTSTSTKSASQVTLVDTDFTNQPSQKSDKEKTGFFGFFKSKKYKREIEDLKKAYAEVENERNNLKQINQQTTTELEQLRASFTPEMHEADQINSLIQSLKEKSNTLRNQIDELNNVISSKETEIAGYDSVIRSKKQEIIETDEKILLQEFGLYEPKYDFANSEQYKAKLQKIRQSQKDMIKMGTAATGNMSWEVNGNAAQGRKMVKDMQKLLLRAFNSECDELVDKVKYNTFDTSLKRITASYEAVSKLGTIMSVSISKRYYDLKIDELTLAFEYRQKKHEEKELQKELRAQMREEARLQKEIEAERKKAEKERTHYKNALSMLEKQIEHADEAELSELLNKKEEIMAHISDAQKALEDIDYREANQRAGYVYVISNIGSFGENVYKIGMTRRLNPMDRVNELGDASVPFNFDVHAMIFSDDAPALESALHRAFENKKVNMVNRRREFFNVSLDEIKEVVFKNFDRTVEFIDLADAEQYRTSLKMKGLI